MKNYILILIGLVFLSLGFLAIFDPVDIPVILAQEPEPTPVTILYFPFISSGWQFPDPNFWRGVGKTGGDWTNLTNVRWFYSWNPYGPWDDSRYVPTIRPWHCDTPEKLERLARLAQQNPNRDWMFLNEPDLKEQDNITPARGAELYEKIYDTIKAVDPGARLYCCGPAFSNTMWMEEFRQYMTRPIDGIHFNAYPCPHEISQECSAYHAFPARFDTDVMLAKMDAFYDWAQSCPEFAGLPIWITEIGTLSTLEYDSHEEVKEKVMTPFLNYYFYKGGYQKFERVAWFSTREPNFSVSNLLSEDSTLTILGKEWNNSCPNP